jgi:peptidoglycan/LPS O-acetylase OafA/YrhL
MRPLASLSRATSLYLDVWRLLAAMTVFVGHVSGKRLTGGFLWQFGPYMGQAVTVFFVLSGFVVSYATARQAGTARSYALSRLARVYSVALPALILTFALDAIGRSVRPDLYSSAWGT